MVLLLVERLKRLLRVVEDASGYFRGVFVGHASAAKVLKLLHLELAQLVAVLDLGRHLAVRFLEVLPTFLNSLLLPVADLLADVVSVAKVALVSSLKRLFTLCKNSLPRT